MMYQLTYRDVPIYVFASLDGRAIVIDRIETDGYDDISPLMSEYVLEDIAKLITVKYGQHIDQELALFDAAEAAAINSGKGGF